MHAAIILGNRKSFEFEPFRWANTFNRNAETAIGGTYHQFDLAKYRQRFIVKVQYRVNRPFDLAWLVRRLVPT